MNMADNEELNQNNPGLTQPTSPVDKDVDVTKIVSKRISEERAKIRQEALDEQAQSLGYLNHEEFIKSMTDEKIMKKGLDPDEVKPLIKDLLKDDPEYQEALRYKKEKEELEKQLWGKQEIERLNKRYGTSFTGVSELSKEVITLWNSGIPLEKAYAAEHSDAIVELAVKRATKGNKSHLTEIQGGNPETGKRVVTADDIARMKRYNPNATEEQIKQFLEKNHNKK